jgi:hypothetical protein
LCGGISGMISSIRKNRAYFCHLYWWLLPYTVNKLMFQSPTTCTCTTVALVCGKSGYKDMKWCLITSINIIMTWIEIWVIHVSVTKVTWWKTIIHFTYRSTSPEFLLFLSLKIAVVVFTPAKTKTPI